MLHPWAHNLLHPCTLLPASHPQREPDRESNISVLSFYLLFSVSVLPPTSSACPSPHWLPPTFCLFLQSLGDLLAGSLALMSHSLLSTSAHGRNLEGCTSGQLLAATTPLAHRFEGTGGPRGRGTAAGSCSGLYFPLLTIPTMDLDLPPSPFQAESSPHLEPLHIWKS